MAAGEILAVIEVCERVGQLGLALYKISKNIADNFKKSRIQLGEEVEALSQRVTTVKTVLEDPDKEKDLKKLSGLREVVAKIEEEFHKIAGFFRKLQRYGGYEAVKYMYTLVTKYRGIQRQFQDFSCILRELDETLEKRSQDCTTVAVMTTQAMVSDLQEEQENQSEDLQEILEKVGDLPEEMHSMKEMLEEFMRQQNFARGRFEPGNPLPKPIKSSEISQYEFLCQGTYCKYYKAVLDREKVVVKWIDDVSDTNVQMSFAKETRNLMMISSGSITRLFGMCDEGKEKFLVMEYMEKGSLSDVLHGGEKLTFPQMVSLASSAAKSVYRIHTKMVHTSLRTEKFLVDKFFTAKLSGMCHAMTFSSCRRYNTSKPHVATSYYRAPELFEPGAPTKEADIYAFGIVLWEIFTQTKPFSKLESEHGGKLTTGDLDKFLNDDKGEEYFIGDQDKLDDPTIKQQLESLIRRCRSLEPGDRPTISEIESTLTGIEDKLDQ